MLEVAPFGGDANDAIRSALASMEANGASVRFDIEAELDSEGISFLIKLPSSVGTSA